jgi:hypothetical protein
MSKVTSRTPGALRLKARASPDSTATCGIDCTDSDGQSLEIIHAARHLDLIHLISKFSLLQTAFCLLICSCASDSKGVIPDQRMQ